MSDTIYRQSAIDELCKRCDLVADEDVPCTEKCNDIKILETLPSAQPTQSNDSNTLNALDCISRQDAIAIVCRALHYNYEEGYAVTQMLALPSAQPERKQVEIEYIAWNEELYGQSAICGNCGCTWQIGNNGEDNFCPNCGARMIRGGKDNDE